MNKKLSVVFLAAAVSGCIVTPQQDQVIDNKETPLSVALFVPQKKYPVRVICRAETDAAAIPVGEFKPGQRITDVRGRRAYLVSGQVTIPDECWLRMETRNRVETYGATVEFFQVLPSGRETNQNMYVMNGQRSAACTANTLARTLDFSAFFSRQCYQTFDYGEPNVPIRYLHIFTKPNELPLPGDDTGGLGDT